MAKLGFKDSLEEFRRISADIKSRKDFAPVYFLMGEETYFIDQLEKLIQANAIEDDARDFNENIIYASKDVKGGDIAAAGFQCPVMSPRMLVIVREAQNLSKIEELLNYMKEPPKTTVLVLSYKGKSLDKRSQLYKAIKDSGVVFESVSPRPYELGGIVKTIAAQHNLTLSEKAEAMLVQYVGGNLQTLNNELQKLSDTMPGDRRQVTDEDIEQKVGVSREYNVFELTAALSECDFRKALQIVDNFASNPKQTPTQIIFPVLHTHFQRILALGVIAWTAKKNGTQMPSDMDLTKKLGLATPFFLKEYKNALLKYPTKKSYTILEMIRSYDMQTKGVGYNSASDHELLRELIIKIMTVN